jgi:tRNA(Ile)-lysidine synthase
LAIGSARGESLEARARQARYAALGGLLGPGELVLTAQHQDDQAETLLLALLRGSGPDGLAAMPAVSDLGSGRLVRPLLDVPRAALEAYARERGLTWVEDPSNDSLAFDRNFLRRRVLPLLQERWPAASATLARSAAHCAEAANLIEGRAGEALAGLSGARPGTLSISALSGLEPPLSRVVLRLWLRRLGLPPPPTVHLGRILTEVLPARSDGNPLVAWPGCEIRRYRGDLFALMPLPPRPRDCALIWKGQTLRLPSPLGALTRAGMDGPSGALGADAVADPLQVRFGVEGQWCRSGPRGHRRPLKKIFQDAGVPPWLRPYVPLVFKGEQLLAVAGLCACPDDPSPAMDPARLRWSGHPWEGLELFCEDAVI